MSLSARPFPSIARRLLAGLRRASARELPRGSVDQPLWHAEIARGLVRFRGWALFEGGPATGVDLWLGEHHLGAARVGIPPGDLSAPGRRPGAKLCGWDYTAELSEIDAPAGPIALKAIAAGPDGDWLEIPPVEYRLAAAGPHRRLEVIDDLEQRVERLEGERVLARIAACETWVAAAEPSHALISVVTPTRNRRALLERAIASVQRQSHERWELLVVDDGSTDDTRAMLAALDDPRIRVLESSGAGAPAARNVALEAAHGDAIAYLDDDNLMLPLWLAAVAWAFAQHPGHQVLYGARIHETMSDSLPETQFEVSTAERLRTGNFLDTNVVAHRPLPDRWDENWNYGADWEFVMRVTRDRPLLPLPVRAVLYSTSTPGRITDTYDPETLAQMIRDRHRS